ncbi:hypothetical protein Taro_011159 [Colocasia esculenta]|uniref:Ubiquitin-like protease family profile domain-containing protein n=1 Tax=Colocasia esculenta TaxID=4460 RepID=A0A843U5J5_COLES|nr:hypothetical protein [Colocasia esculenta]
MMMTLGEELLADVTILDCFWYHMYLNGSPKVMEWIKEKGIFLKTYTFVPIVDGFVKDLYHTQGKLASSRTIGSISLLLPKVPQQKDGEVCGVFTLYYIYLFLKSAPTTFSFTSYPYFV